MIRHAFVQVWQYPLVRVVVVLTLLALVALFLYQTRVAWVTFLLAYVVAYLLNPVVTYLQRRRVPRWLGVLTIAVGFGLLVGLISFVISIFVDQVTDFAEDLPALGMRAVAWYESLPGRLGRFIPPPLVQLLTGGGDMEAVFANATEGLTAQLDGLGADMFAVVLGFAGGVAQSAVLLVLSIFLLYGFDNLNESFLRVVPRRYQGGVRELAFRLDLSVGGYMRAQLVIALLVGVLIWLGMSVTGVPLAIGCVFQSNPSQEFSGTRANN